MNSVARELDPERPVEGQLLRIVKGEAVEASRAMRMRGVSFHERFHRTRVICKRLRAALKLLGSADRPYTLRLERRVAEATRELGRIRDTHSLISAFDSLVKRHAPGDRRFHALRGDLVGLQPPSDEIREVSRTFLRVLAGVRQRLSARRARDGGFERISAGLKEAYRSGRRAYRRALEQGTSADFHRLRRRAKTLGNDLRLVRCAWKPMVKAYQHACDEINEALGGHHDLQLLLRHLERIDFGPSRQGLVRRLRGWIAEDSGLAEVDAARNAERLFELRPRRWTRMLADEWAAAA